MHRQTIPFYGYAVLFMWLNRHNLFTLLGLRQSQHLICGQVAPSLEGILALVGVYGYQWASPRATLPIAGRVHSIAAHITCQGYKLYESWYGRIGVWVARSIPDK